MKTAKPPANEFKEIEGIILNKICKEASANEHDDIAEIIKKIVPKLDSNNTQWEWGKDVTDFSSAVKEETRDRLFIQTKFPDWFKIDRKILEEKLSEGVSIQTSFAKCKYPIDENMLEMDKIGIETVIVPGLPSINISKKGLTFYYVDDPLSTEPKSRVAISIEGRIGRRLSKYLYPRYMKKFADSEFRELLPSMKKRVKEAMVKIMQNRDERETLHDLVYDKSLDNFERICLSVFFFQFGDDKYIPIREIEKDTGLEFHQIKSEIGRFVNLGVLFEYKPSVGATAGEVKLTWNGISSDVPRILFDILQDKKFQNDLKLLKIMFTYGLTKKKILGMKEPLTTKAKM